MSQAILALELIVGVLLVVVILMQSKGSGLSAVFGGEGGMYRSRRGVEKLLHRGTILLAITFMALALANILINK